jgi:hypothetical protein
VNVVGEKRLLAGGTDYTFSGEEGQVGSASAPGAPRRYRRYLEVYNATSEPVTVRLQYLTMNDQAQWTWVPIAPGQSSRALMFRLKPGEKTYLQDDGDYLAAHRVRMWATSEGGTEWLEFKDNDLELIDIDQESGERCYYAEDMETFTYTLQ